MEKEQMCDVTIIIAKYAMTDDNDPYAYSNVYKADLDSALVERLLSFLEGLAGNVEMLVSEVK